MMGGHQRFDLAWGLDVEASADATAHGHARCALPSRPVTGRSEAAHSRARFRQSERHRQRDRPRSATASNPDLADGDVTVPSNCPRCSSAELPQNFWSPIVPHPLSLDSLARIILPPCYQSRSWRSRKRVRMSANVLASRRPARYALRGPLEGPGVT